MRLAYRCELGHVRRRNEDAVLVPAPEALSTVPWVVAVSDGMGGHPAGDAASEITVHTLGDALRSARSGDDLVAALKAAHRAIRVAAQADPTRTGMGATAVVALVQPDRAQLAHIGDSRGYLVRNGDARQLTEDHYQAGYLTQSLGHGAITPPIVTVDLRPGDRLLLCTDGLTGPVPDEALADLATIPDLEHACDRLVNAALVAGGPDNISVILVEV